MAKVYANYLKNQRLRRKNEDIRRIVNGQPKSFWSTVTTGLSMFEKPLVEVPAQESVSTEPTI